MRADGKAYPGQRGLALAACLLGAGVLMTPARAEAPRQVDFAHDIVPILKARCAECHTNGKRKGSLSLDTREAILKAKAVVPGKSGESALFARIPRGAPEARSPPRGDRLSAGGVGRVRGGIARGLPGEQGSPSRPSPSAPPLKPRRPTLPPPIAGR